MTQILDTKRNFRRLFVNFRVAHAGNCKNESMAPKLKEIERLNKAPKPRNVKEKIDLLREKSDHYHFASVDETGRYSDGDKREFSSCEIRERSALLKLSEEATLDDTFIGTQNRAIGEAYSRIGNCLKAIEYFNNYIELADKSGDFLKKCIAYYTRGKLYNDNQNYKKSLQDNRDALRFIEIQTRGGATVMFGATDAERRKRQTETVEMRFRCYASLAQILLNIGEAEKGQRRLNNAIRISKEFNLIRDKFDFFILIGSEETYRGNLKSADKKFREALSSIDHISDKSQLDDCKYNLYVAWGENYLAMYQLSHALSFYRDAYAIRPKVIETKTIYKTLFYLESVKRNLESCSEFEKIKLTEKQGDICVRLYQKFHFNRLLIGALSRYTEQLNLAKAAKEGEYDISAIYSSIAMTYVDMDEVDSAIEHYRFAISESNSAKGKQSSYIMDMIELMAESMDKQNEPIYPTDNVLKEFESALPLLRDRPRLQLRLMEFRKKFKLENDLPVLDDVEEMTKLEDQVENESMSEDEEETDDLDEEIERVELPTPIKKATASGKPWWDAGRNRLGETELQRRVIDLKLTHEPKEKLALIDDLIKVRGHPVNVCDNTGLTPLHEAANWGLPKVARILLREGANVDAETLQNMEFENEASGAGSCEGCITPLQDVTGSLVGEEMEIILKKIELISVLIEYNPNVLKRNKDGKTPLQVLSDSTAEIERTYSDITDEKKNIFTSCKKSLSMLTEKQAREQRKSGANTTRAGSSTPLPSGVSMFARLNSTSPVKNAPRIYPEAIEVGSNKRVSRVERILALDKKDFGEEKKAPPLKNWLSNRTQRRGETSTTPKRLLIEQSDSDQETENRENMSKRRKTAFIVSDEEDDEVPFNDAQSIRTSSTVNTKTSVKSSESGQSLNTQKMRFTISYNAADKKQKFRITACPQRQLDHFFKKIQDEIVRREGKPHQSPEIAVFINSSDGNIELTPSDYISDAIDFDAKENEKIEVTVKGWCQNRNVSSSELYVQAVNESDLEINDELRTMLSNSNRSGSISLNSITLHNQPQLHLSAVFTAISGPAIQELNLSGQNISTLIGPLSKSIDNMANLDKLLLSNCRLTKDLLRELHPSPGVLTYRYSLKLSIFYMPYLAHLIRTGLPGIKLFGNPADNQFVLSTPNPRKCNSLRLLDLSSNITGDCGLELAKLLSRFPNVEDLRISRMRLSHVTFEHYDLDFSRLLSLTISQNLKIGAIGLENIRLLLKDSPTIHTLEASQITVSDDIFTPFTKLFSEIEVQEIRNVKLMKNNIKNEHIEDNLSELSLFTQMEYLNLSHNRALTADVITSLLEQVQTVKDVTLHGTAVDDRAQFAQQYYNRITF